MLTTRPQPASSYRPPSDKGDLRVLESLVRTGVSGRPDLKRQLAKRAALGMRRYGRLERALDRFAAVRYEQNRYEHRLIVPLSSTYSPWHADERFRQVFDAISAHTFVDQYRCWELWEQIEMVSAVAGDVLEVGVWRGGSGILMARRMRDLGDSGKVFLADTFEGVVGASEADPAYRGGEHDDTSPAIVRSLAARLDTDVEILVGSFPHDTGYLIADRSFKLAHIDVDVYLSSKAIFEWVFARMPVGGVVVFDDFGSFECEGVTQFGNEIRAHSMAACRAVHNLNGHLVVVKIADAPLGSRLPQARRIEAHVD